MASVQDESALVGDKIEMQWEGDEEWYLCVVAMGEDDSLVVDLDGEVFDFDPKSDTWRFPPPPEKKQRIYKEDSEAEDTAPQPEEEEEDEEIEVRARARVRVG